jgi:hypothetical protein
MQHDGAERGTAHARIGNAHHVLEALGGELLRDRQIAGLWHRRVRMRSGVLQHHEVVGVDVEVGVIDARGEIGERGEDHRPALFLEQRGIGGRALEDRTLRGEIAEQCDQPALRLQRLVAFRDDVAVDPGVAVETETLAERFAGNGHGIEMQQVFQFAHQRAHAAGGIEIFHVAVADGLQVHQNRRGVG